jgi:ABC-type transport system involved in Fe-S cluster assembly fused permease/ATPase subunit
VRRLDTILSYETVHHSGAIPIEAKRFEGHVTTYQRAEFTVLTSLNTLNIIQNVIYIIGILLVTLLSSFQISKSIHPVAVFVSVLTYFAQLQAPLQFFGSFYNQVQNNLIDAERMLDLVC